jgi:hypothetical protein
MFGESYSHMGLVQSLAGLEVLHSFASICLYNYPVVRASRRHNSSHNDSKEVCYSTVQSRISLILVSTYMACSSLQPIW